MCACIFAFDVKSQEKDMKGGTFGCWHCLFKRGGDEGGK